MPARYNLRSPILLYLCEEPMQFSNVLTVESVRITPKAQTQANNMCKMLADLLSALGYKGKWTISFQRQTSNKIGDFVFQAIRKHSPTSLICRGKYGGANTCWDFFLNPPAHYDVDDVFETLKTVPRNAKIKTKLLGRSITQAINQKAPMQPLIGIGQSKVPVPTTDHVVSNPPVVKTEVAKPVIETKPTKPNPLLLTMGEHSNIKVMEDNEFLNKALVAICFGIDSFTLYINRVTTMKLLYTELGLDNFIKDNSAYSTKTAVATTLIRGLVNKGLLSRCGSAQRKKTQRVRDTTKGYMLTPTGRQRVESFKAGLDESIQKRLFHPELLSLTNVEIDEPETEIVETTAVPINNVDNLAAIVKDFETRRKAVEECDAILSNWQKNYDELANSITPFHQRLVALHVEVKEIQSKIDGVNSQLETMKTERENIKILRAEEQAALDVATAKLSKVVANK